MIFRARKRTDLGIICFAHDAGVEAIICTLAGTAKFNGVESCARFKDVLNRLPSPPINRVAEHAWQSIGFSRICYACSVSARDCMWINRGNFEQVWFCSECHGEPVIRRIVELRPKQVLIEEAAMHQRWLLRYAASAVDTGTPAPGVTPSSRPKIDPTDSIQAIPRALPTNICANVSRPFLA